MLETLPSDGSLNHGTPIGYSASAGSENVVCIPYLARCEHTHLIGRPGAGKTSVMEGMILDDVRRGVGLVILDPCGDLCERLLLLLPADAVERTIYLDPGDPDWIPMWNPFGPVATHGACLDADDMVIAFKNIVEGFGDRLDHILRNIFLVLSSLPGCTLLDAYNVLRSGTPASEELRARILQRTDNGLARNFWAHDFEKYRDDDLSPLRNKLGKLLLAGPASLMLSQPENAFHLGEVMNEGKILLVNLSRIGFQVRRIVGSLLLSQFRQEALRRSEIPVTERRESHLYCDEAQHFATNLLVDLIAEARRYDVGVTLAHQNMRQFDPRERDALPSVGSTIVFAVDQADAEYLTENLLNVGRSEDLV
ncbi:MAG: type IV secretory system conjugative DNA transfer family protein, partial [Dehalococcoidia bacterium]